LARFEQKQILHPQKHLISYCLANLNPPGCKSNRVLSWKRLVQSCQAIKLGIALFATFTVFKNLGNQGDSEKTNTPIILFIKG